MKTKILIVDDEAPIRMLLEQTLEEIEEEFELYRAKDGEEALKIILQEKPNIVFLDVMMPGLTGYEVLDKIRDKAELKDIKIILLTAKGSTEEIKMSNRYNIHLYITKPFDPDFIVEKTLELLQ
ncbi:response regulator [Clostridium intestinale]|jgi:DNA-binding response OmpR family regulator|uniref:Stage 0 sporulation protein A homolog n=2 Tax=Clostridium intestinale TaxID=36845 RepID=U2Q0I8_9CLOT|nr:response regulator [Clostridium intestinale]ERK32285.1 response regulator [Clostridium intestinale URNW]QLY79401.1 response regulator [Clostridium intestinale]